MVLFVGRPFCENTGFLKRTRDDIPLRRFPETNGMWDFKACQIELLPTRDRIPFSRILIIIVMWNTHTPHSINTCTCKHTKIRHAKYGKEARNRTNEATPRKYHIGERQIESKSEANRNEKVNYYLSIIHSVLRTKDSRQYKQFVTVVEIPNQKKKK